jgi:hypothetical protein
MIVELPVSWLLGIIGVLGTTIATLATVIWAFMKSRLDNQDKLIASQSAIIGRLQDDVDRLSKGCGMDACVWRVR